MMVKIFEENSNSVFFHSLSDQMDRKVKAWCDEHADIEIISVTPSFHNIKETDDGDLVTIMNCVVIYK